MDKQTQPLSPALIEEVLAHKPQAVAELVRQAIVDQADAFSPLIQARNSPSVCRSREKV